MVSSTIDPKEIFREYNAGEKGSSKEDILHFVKIYQKMTNGSKVHIMKMGHTERQVCNVC